MKMQIINKRNPVETGSDYYAAPSIPMLPPKLNLMVCIQLRRRRALWTFPYRCLGIAVYPEYSAIAYWPCFPACRNGIHVVNHIRSYPWCCSCLVVHPVCLPFICFAYLQRCGRTGAASRASRSASTTLASAERLRCTCGNTYAKPSVSTCLP